MQNFLYEILRLYPSLAILPLRIVTEDIRCNDNNGDGFNIARGSLICIPIVLIQQNPDYFSEPEKFKMGRDYRNPAFIPFSSGKNMCPGRNLAINRAANVVTALLKQFEFSSQQPEGDMPDKKYIFGISPIADPASTVTVKLAN